MKKNPIITLCFTCILSLLVTSCESLIEIDLPDNQINREIVFTDINTANSALAGLYLTMRNKSVLSGNTTGMGYFMGMYTDEIESLFNTTNDFYYIYNNNPLPTNNLINNIWTNTYSNIYAINSFIEGLTSSKTIPEQQKRNLLGEAFVLRALQYQVLAQLFGDIPYTTTTDHKINNTLKKTKSIEILMQVQQDLLLAFDLLDYNYRDNERIYPNKSVVELLLAKNYLLQKDYVKAEFYANNIISNPNYQLQMDINKVFKKNASSTLWQLHWNAQGNATLEASTYIFVNTPNNQILSKTFVESFETLDRRKDNWIKIIKQDDTVLWAHPYKYKNKTNNTDEYSIVFRIEDVYFLLAEALIYQEKITPAIELINKIRQRAGLQDLPYNISKEVALDYLLIESHKEFFTEQGHRFFDLKRNNRLSILSYHKPNWQQRNELLPYPEKDILINPNLLPQNHGY
ncbi:MAG: RagB/SusD family nutrient uptake outer membrane protein [Flavobacteriaceae bacterium]|jgi:hypothetical protein|nr:RagB/SusD family nutrient uptake outer membrane protein [Flavobacteriaceae bacterium]